MVSKIPVNHSSNRYTLYKYIAPAEISIISCLEVCGDLQTLLGRQLIRICVEQVIPQVQFLNEHLSVKRLASYTFRSTTSYFSRIAGLIKSWIDLIL